jgi:glycerate dehydrogenase
MEENKVVVSASMSDESKARVNAVFEGFASVVFLADMDKNARKEAISGASALISFFFNKEIDSSEYDLMKGTQLLQTISTGVDYLPFADIPENVQIACNAGGWAYQIAEHSVAMIMALYKRLVPQHNNLSRGEFDRPRYLLRNLRGKTLGVIGYGGIGRHTARMLKAFDVKILALNTSGKTSDDVEFIGTLDDLDTLLKRSDIVLLSIPLTKHTEGLIGKDELNKMKEDATLINVARAPLVDEGALYEHLCNNPEFLAGIDVWWEEPSWSDSEFHVNFPFFELPNFLGSPHNSNYVKDAFPEALLIASENVRACLKGEKVKGLVHREDYMK